MKYLHFWACDKNLIGSCALKQSNEISDVYFDVSRTVAYPTKVGS